LFLKFLSFNRERNYYNNTKGVERVIDILRKPMREEKERERERERDCTIQQSVLNKW
jgi:hypothetical protein